MLIKQTDEEMAYEYIQELHDLFDMFDNEREEYIESLSEEERQQLAKRMITTLKMIFGNCRVHVEGEQPLTIKLVLGACEQID
jgi:hypothetical protein